MKPPQRDPGVASDAGRPVRPLPLVRLRQWQDADRPLFAAMNADPQVMEYFLRPWTVDESHAALERFQREIADRGWGLWAVEHEGALAGCAGLAEPGFVAPFTPCLEVAWRFRPEFWGRGIALAAAREAIAYAFDRLGREEVVAYTTATNLRSRRLMERLAFTRDPAEDFLHPRVPADHPLRVHVLYRKRPPGAGTADPTVGGEPARGGDEARARIGRQFRL